MSEVHRRKALHLLGAGAGTALLAGCSESSDDTGTNPDDESSGDDQPTGELPSYAPILPETDDQQYFYGAIDQATIAALRDDEGPEDGAEPTDPLLANPVAFTFNYYLFGLSQLAESASFEPYRENDRTDDGNGAFVFVDGTYALKGTYAFDGFTSDLEDAGYDVETEAETYAVYTDPDSGEVVGVSDKVFAFSYPNANDPDFDPITSVERTVATAAGDREPKHETDDEFESLVRAGENDGIAVCLYTTDDEFDEDTLSNETSEDGSDGPTFDFTAFAGAAGVQQRLSITEDDVAARATSTVVYSSDDRVDETGLESELGTDADTTSVDRDGTSVTVTADYAGEIVDE
ncbi:hypothetical protein ACFO5R_07200 [Halosolutus amylolyticus]|uniref:Uncharacterized protein n=1 Tax=Halosolutus amylolyticus TaxID=2932267 RepID=A0ABD5PNT9_9EURY|nr:hypothetical protein [Halosolutus amylolyticus]